MTFNLHKLGILEVANTSVALLPIRQISDEW